MARLPEAVADQQLARVRRRRVRSALRDARPLLLMVGAVITVVLGYWGFRRSPGTSGGDIGDTLYRDFKLFGFSGGDIDPPVAWQLQIARILAPLLVGYAAVRGLITLFRQEASLLRLRLFARRHVVVCGFGQAGGRLALELHDAGLRVVVIEQDPQHPGLEGARSRSIPVIAGDAGDPEILFLARADRARHVFACCGADEINLRVLAACHSLAGDPGWTPSTVHVLIDSYRLWQQLRGEQQSVADCEVQAEFRHLPDLYAKALIDAVPDALPTAPQPWAAHVVCVSPVGRRVVEHLARRATRQGAPLSLTLTADDDERRALLADLPWLTGGADVTWRGEDDPVPAASQLTVVCTAPESDALSGAVQLAEQAGAVLIAQAETDDLAASLDASHIGFAGVHPVGVAQRVLTASLLLDSTVEAIARARHEQYVQHEIEHGATVEGNDALRPWETLPEALKDSHRRVAHRLATAAPGDQTALHELPDLLERAGLRLEGLRTGHDTRAAHSVAAP